VGWSRRNTIQASGAVKIFDRPGSADAANHPPQNRLEIAIQDISIDRFEGIHDRIDFKT
jgi:hypothetical protein